MANVDTLRRHWMIVAFLRSQTRFLKRAVSATQVYDHLSSKDIQVSPRMVQRDLNLLQRAIPGVKRRPGTPAGWIYEPSADEC